MTTLLPMFYPDLCAVAENGDSPFKGREMDFGIMVNDTLYSGIFRMSVPVVSADGNDCNRGRDPIQEERR